MEHKHGLQGMGMSGSASMDMSMGLRARVWDSMDRTWSIQGMGYRTTYGTHTHGQATGMDMGTGLQV